MFGNVVFQNYFKNKKKVKNQFGNLKNFRNEK